MSLLILFIISEHPYPMIIFSRMMYSFDSSYALMVPFWLALSNLFASFLLAFLVNLSCYFPHYLLSLHAIWSSGNALTSGAGGLRFQPRSGQIKTVLQMVRHRCDISSKEAVLPWRNNVERSPVNS